MIDLLIFSSSLSLIFCSNQVLLLKNTLIILKSIFILIGRFWTTTKIHGSVYQGRHSTLKSGGSGTGFHQGCCHAPKPTREGATLTPREAPVMPGGRGKPT